jgi:peptidoglycan pentaglycine glycine transferase (the first glycine)
MATVTLEDWESFGRDQAELHFLQTAEWGRVKSRFGWEAVAIIRQGLGVQILFRRLPLGLSVAYIPRADPRLADASASDIWAEIDALGRERRSVFCKLEIDSWEHSDGTAAEDVGRLPRFGRNGPSIQPRRTITVDLRPAEGEILAQMKPKCRYNIRLASRKGVTVHPWDDIDGFHKLCSLTGRRDGFSAHPKEYYRMVFNAFRVTGSCELFVAQFESTPLAAILVLSRGSRAWYVYGGSAEIERDRMPAYALQWEAMRWAKARGCEVYDLWGVPDAEESELEAGFEHRGDGLWGVYRFKRGFAGELRRSPAALDRVYQPLLYSLYRKRVGMAASP